MFLPPAELHELILTLATEAIVVGTALITAYFKLKAEFIKKIQEVKHHTEVSVQKLNGTLSYVINSFGRPAWIKVAKVREDGNVEFRMMEMNDAYCQKYGFKRNQYIGKTDLEAGWNKETADMFRKHDLMVWSSGEAEDFTEEVGGESVRFRKIRLQNKDGNVKGILGFEVDCNDPLNCPCWSKQPKENSNPNF